MTTRNFDALRPRLPRGVRLSYDASQACWLMLAPERIFKPDEIAVQIIRRCDGERSVADIVDDLSENFDADRSEVRADVIDFLRDLADKRVLDL